MDRLTGGACSGNSGQKGRTTAANATNSATSVKNSATHALRNESYYMATNETWSPALHHQQHVNNSVLIEHDPEPISP